MNMCGPGCQLGPRPLFFPPTAGRRRDATAGEMRYAPPTSLAAAGETRGGCSGFMRAARRCRGCRVVGRMGTDAHLYHDDDATIPAFPDSRFDADEADALKRPLALIGHSAEHRRRAALPSDEERGDAVDGGEAKERGNWELDCARHPLHRPPPVRRNAAYTPT
uniref:Uncharacterized protein n=1 Tax=Hordeum vulgare subsp. vulgare TaxID=112509 RepID=A0A8I6XIX9_HORVV